MLDDLTIAEIRALCRACELATDANENADGLLSVAFERAMKSGYEKLRRELAVRPKSTRRAAL